MCESICSLMSQELLSYTGAFVDALLYVFRTWLPICIHTILNSATGETLGRFNLE